MELAALDPCPLPSGTCADGPSEATNKAKETRQRLLELQCRVQPAVPVSAVICTAGWGKGDRQQMELERLQREERKARKALKEKTGDFGWTRQYKTQQNELKALRDNINKLKNSKSEAMHLAAEKAKGEHLREWNRFTKHLTRVRVEETDRVACVALQDFRHQVGEAEETIASVMIDARFAEFVAGQYQLFIFYQNAFLPRTEPSFYDDTLDNTDLGKIQSAASQARNVIGPKSADCIVRVVRRAERRLAAWGLYIFNAETQLRTTNVGDGEEFTETEWGEDVDFAIDIIATSFQFVHAPTQHGGMGPMLDCILVRYSTHIYHQRHHPYAFRMFEVHSNAPVGSGTPPTLQVERVVCEPRLARRELPQVDPVPPRLADGVFLRDLQEHLSLVEW